MCRRILKLVCGCLLAGVALYALNLFLERGYTRKTIAMDGKLVKALVSESRQEVVVGDVFHRTRIYMGENGIHSQTILTAGKITIHQHGKKASERQTQIWKAAFN